LSDDDATIHSNQHHLLNIPRFSLLRLKTKVNQMDRRLVNILKSFFSHLTLIIQVHKLTLYYPNF